MSFFTNWKTSIAGLTTILGAVVLVGKMLSTGAFDVNTISLAVTQIIAGVGVMFAKDANVVGAPPTAVAK